NANITSASHVLFQFRFVGKGGSNLYIDDINISSPAGIVWSGMSAFFSIAPNPASEQIGLFIGLTQKQDITIELFDISGRQVALLMQGEMEAGNHNIQLLTGQMPRSGVYFVRLMASDGSVVTQKLVIE
ncbi:MAG: T9SS type A sorting domain-containing protein, partial [Bacteroidia bacterium]